jgi:hypothetical protein
MRKHMAILTATCLISSICGLPCAAVLSGDSQVGSLFEEHQPSTADKPEPADPMGPAQTEMPISFFARCALIHEEDSYGRFLPGYPARSAKWVASLDIVSFNLKDSWNAFQEMTGSERPTPEQERWCERVLVLYAIASDHRTYIRLGSKGMPIEELTIDLHPKERGPRTVGVKGLTGQRRVTIQAETVDWERSADRRIAWTRLCLIVYASPRRVDTRGDVFTNDNIWFGVVEDRSYRIAGGIVPLANSNPVQHGKFLTSKVGEFRWRTDLRGPIWERRFGKKKFPRGRVQPVSTGIEVLTSPRPIAR